MNESVGDATKEVKESAAFSAALNGPVLGTVGDILLEWEKSYLRSSQPTDRTQEFR